MTLLEKINLARTKDELKLLEIEIILDHENYYANKGAYVAKLREVNYDKDSNSK